MRTTFSNEDIAIFRKHPCVFSCTEKSINYTYEFKLRVLDQYAKGINPREIWKQAGFDTSKWKKQYFSDTIKDWKRLVKKGGLERLTKLGGIQSDGGHKKSRTPEMDRVRRLELQVRYLEAENDFLAKLRAKRAESISGRMKNSRSLES